jgi:hypothetical protein
MVGDAGPDQGIQRIAYQRGAVAGRATVVMIGRSLFLFGDRTVLGAYMGFAPKLAAQLADSWVLVPRTSKAYGPISADVELGSSFWDELAMQGPLRKLAPSMLGGKRVIGIRGHSTTGGKTAVATLYVRAVGRPLPVAQVEQQGSNKNTVTLSGWNEPVHVTAPSPKFILR